MARISRLLRELSRRRVFRTVIAYIVVIWALSQGASELFPRFGVDDRWIRIFIIALVLGIPVVAVLSWRFNLTLKGVVPDPFSDPGILTDQGEIASRQRRDRTVVARDPEQLGSTTRVTGAREGNLADMGFMREYIEDLPYTPEVMGLSLDDWQSWSTKQQVAFVTRLEDKLDYYRALHDHTDLWVSLDGGPISGDSVFPIPLEMLP